LKKQKKCLNSEGNFYYVHIDYTLLISLKIIQVFTQSFEKADCHMQELNQDRIR
jgi:hypothetical protein